MQVVLKTLFLLIFSACALGHTVPEQSAQGRWVSEPTTTPGCNAIVNASARMPNGDVIFGGSFTRCGSVRANRVVRFDGSNFFSVGFGAENGVDGTVRAVFVDAGKIYVGGHFTAAGSVKANNIAVFENGEWRSVGLGSNNGVSGYVRAIQTFQDKLYVGGYDVSTANYFAWRASLLEWNGSTWRHVLNFELQGDDSSINALTADTFRLYFGGSFRPKNSQTDYNLASFDGAALTFQGFPIFSNIGRNRVRDLHFFQNRLCVAGSFTLMAPPRNSGVACQQGNDWAGLGSFYSLKALEDIGATLFAAGNLQDNSAQLIAFTSSGISYFSATQPGGNDSIQTLSKNADTLLVGGQFAQQQPQLQNVMRLSKGALHPIAAGAAPKLNGALSQMIVANERVYGVDHYNAFAAPLVPYRIHEMSNGIWSEIAQPGGNSDVIGHLLVKDNSLYFSGGYDSSGFGGLFVWSGFNWTEIGNGMNADFVYQDKLTRISAAQEDGTRIVQRLVGQAFEPFLVIPRLKKNGFALDDFVQLTLSEFRGSPVIAGSFNEMVGVGPVGSVAVFYENAWHPLGKQGLTDLGSLFPGGYAKFSVVEWQNQLYVSNGFIQADGLPVEGIARFDGTDWRSVGGGISMSDQTHGGPAAYLIPYQNGLYAYGNFDRAGQQPANHVAQWDGINWRTLGSGDAQGLGTDQLTLVSNAVIANGDLLFSGEIHEAGGEPADFFAVWRGSDLMFEDSFE